MSIKYEEIRKRRCNYMKKLLVMCGSGIATSTVVTKRVKDWLADNGLSNDVKIIQSKIQSEVNHLDDYDAVISTTAVPDNVKEKAINGIPLLTGVGTDNVFKELKDKLG